MPLIGAFSLNKYENVVLPFVDASIRVSEPSELLSVAITDPSSIAKINNFEPEFPICNSQQCEDQQKKSGLDACGQNCYLLL